ncbi:MAG TPA: phage tail assembly protein [Methylocystis sp.]|jgi:hypothetical protein
MADDASAPTVSDLDASKGSWGSTSFTLDHPFVWKGATYQEIELRVPTGHDMRRFYDDKSVKSFDFLIGLSQLSPDVFDAMHASDVIKLYKWAMDFFPAAQ